MEAVVICVYVQIEHDMNVIEPNAHQGLPYSRAYHSQSKCDINSAAAAAVAAAVNAAC